MNLIWRLAILYVINGLSLYIAGKFVPGFVVPLTIAELAAPALLFTLLNSIIKPILKLILAPIIWISLGLASLLLNAGMLFILDKLSEKVIISGAVPLIVGTLIITLVNALCQRLLLHRS